MEEIIIDSEYITLGQALKITNVVSSGGMAKWYLKENNVYVNGEIDNRRGRKLYSGDVINIPNHGKFVIVNKNGDNE